MKQFIGLCVIMVLNSCADKNPKEVNQQVLIGNWSWVKTVYKGSKTETPKTIGSGQTMEFTATGFVKTRRNGVKINQLPYVFENGQLNINSNHTEAYFKNDTLVLGGSKNDLGKMFYIKN